MTTPDNHPDLLTMNPILKNLINNSTIMDGLNDGVYIVDTQRRILYWNHAAEKITGFTSQDVVGKKCQDNILTHIDENGCHLCKTGCPLISVIAKGQKKEVDVFLHHRQGHRIPVHVRGTPVHDLQGKVIACVEIFNIQTPAVTMADRLSKIDNKSLLDHASGLPNRAYLEQKLNIKLRAGRTLGVIQITLNHYPQLLSTYGQKTMNQMMDVIGKTLVANSQPTDTAGRYKNDSMIVLVEDVQPQELRQKAAILLSILNKCTCPHGDHDIKINVTVSTTMVKHEDTLPILTRRIIQSLNSIDDHAA